MTNILYVMKPNLSVIRIVGCDHVLAELACNNGAYIRSSTLAVYVCSIKLHVQRVSSILSSLELSLKTTFG